MDMFGKGQREKKEIARRMLIDEVVVDLVNGVPKSEILIKLQDGIYEHVTAPSLSMVTSYRVYNAAMAKIRQDSEDSIAEKRELLWSRYENLYRESLELGNHMNARACLSDMAKIFGLSEPEKQEVTIKDAVISFGFGKNEDKS